MLPGASLEIRAGEGRAGGRGAGRGGLAPPAVRSGNLHTLSASICTLAWNCHRITDPPPISIRSNATNGNIANWTSHQNILIISRFPSTSILLVVRFPAAPAPPGPSSI